MGLHREGWGPWPAVISKGTLLAVGTLNSVNPPEVDIRPILFAQP